MPQVSDDNDHYPKRLIVQRIAIGVLAGCGIAVLVIISALYVSNRAETNIPNDVADATTRGDLATPLIASLSSVPQPTTSSIGENSPESDPKESEPITLEQLFALASPAVVKITAKNENGHDLAVGSGFLIAPVELNSPEQVETGNAVAALTAEIEGAPMKTAYIVTNYHVIEAALDSSVELLDGTTGHVTDILVQSAKSDLAVLIALLKTDATLKTLPLARDMPAIGSSSCAIGSPLDLDYSISNGIISSIRKSADETIFLQTTTAISPGSSGGPLLSMQGRVIGITTSTRIGGQNLNFAVSSKTLLKLLDGTYNEAPLWKDKSYRRVADEAFSHLRFALIPKEGGRTKLEITRGQDAVLFAHALCDKHKYDEALEALSGIRTPTPEPFRYLEQYVWGQAYGGLVETGLKDNLSKQPNDPHKDLASIIHEAVRRTSHFDDAIRCFEESANLNPKFAPTFAMLTTYHSLAGQWEQALVSADRLIALMPLCSEAHSQRAKCYDSLAGFDGNRANDYAEKLRLAAADYRRAIELDARNPSNHWQLAQILSNGLLDHEPAIHSYKRAIDEGIQGPWLCYHGMAFAYAGLGNYDAAEKCLAQALHEGLPKTHYDDGIMRLRRMKSGQD